MGNPLLALTTLAVNTTTVTATGDRVIIRGRLNFVEIRLELSDSSEDIFCSVSPFQLEAMQ
jgi:hypothetical protein